MDYNTTLADIVDNHAPQKSRIVTVRAYKPWYTAELSQEKRLRRRYERKYNQSKLTVDKLQLQEQRNKYNALLNSTKKDYFKNKIEMPNHQKIFIKYAISFWFGNKKLFYHRMIVLNR